METTPGGKERRVTKTIGVTEVKSYRRGFWDVTGETCPHCKGAGTKVGGSDE